jgi:predicted DNA-binding transcriptional regulator AlpA
MKHDPGEIAVNRKVFESGAQPLHTDQLLTEFLINSNVGLGVIDDQLRYRALNLCLAGMNGVPIEFHLGKTLREILGDFALQVEPAVKHVLTTGLPIFNFVVNGVLPTRSEATCFVDHLLPLRDRHGHVKQVGAVVVELRPNAKTERANGVQESGKPWPNTRTEILRSWKEVANYVGACVKTVQRWESQYDFPIRRLDRRKGAVVFAFEAEVNNWLQMRTRRPS